MSDLRPYERRRLAVRIVLKRFKHLREKARFIGNISVIEAYRKMFDGSYVFDGDFADVVEFTLEKLDQGILLYEDLAPMLYLKGKLYGITRRGKHSPCCCGRGAGLYAAPDENNTRAVPCPAVFT